MSERIRLEIDNEQQNVEEESEMINKKFIELIRSRQEISEMSERMEFKPEEVELLERRFLQLCPDRVMSYEQFRKSLGLLGREESFLSRIFYLLDENSDGQLSLEDYLEYLDIILNGTGLQKARFSWLLLTQGKGELELEDFLDIFQEISVLWNGLTGEILAPKKKYIEQLFRIFDVDQDDLITFQDFQIYFDEQPNLFGWFEYLNNLELEDSTLTKELGGIRAKLRERLNLGNYVFEELSEEEIGYRLKDTQASLEKKMAAISAQLKSTIAAQEEKQSQLSCYSKKTTFEDSEVLNHSKESSLENDQHDVGSISVSSIPESISLRSMFKYNHQQSEYESMGRIKSRRHRQEKQTKINSGIELMKGLQDMLKLSYRALEHCQEHRLLQAKQQKYSPSKLKQLEIKFNIIEKPPKSEEGPQSQKRKMRVYFGHENWNLVLNIMVGLRKSIKSLYDLASHLKVKDDHFTEEHEFMLGNKTTMGKYSEVYKFVEKAPLIFERLRAMYGLSNENYQRSVGPQSLLNQLFLGNLQALNEKCSTGKSGSFFYLTLDNKVFLKTIKKSEYEFFEKILKNYYEHMRNYKNSLIVRVYGLYKLKLFVNKEKVNTIYFIAMENIFCHVSEQNHLRPQETYDLKGSLYGRTGESSSEFKDQDWIAHQKRIRLPPHLRQVFVDQVVLDSKFFKRNNINDYSMMIAFVPLQPHSRLLEHDTENVFKRFSGGVKSSEPNLLYVISIIDFLTSFEGLKNMEYLFKSTFLSKDVSCVPPAEYSKRFRDFILNSVATKD